MIMEIVRDIFIGMCLDKPRVALKSLGEGRAVKRQAWMNAQTS